MDRTTSLANSVRLACQLVSRRVRFDVEATLPPHQMAVLWHLTFGPATPGALAEVERVSAPSMTRTLDCLEEAGCISREQDPDDGRRRIVAITDQGRAELSRTASARDSWMEARLRELPEADRATLARAVELLHEVIR
ncbi:MarR family winged helix-turn-helix transcriptional regulator [uncultured Tessaracoccus sp.]|uniref:MarR family winged helix-turn-helix transcriptional regulator n=1 Tax=uncultured Tessaracoccus sp. TaxID=905023 RepID=UPI0025F43312|nr:MarR family transcriptional regulator [uncultured Tessaracoccus sp.]